MIHSRMPKRVRHRSSGVAYDHAPGVKLLQFLGCCDCEPRGFGLSLAGPLMATVTK